MPRILCLYRVSSKKQLKGLDDIPLQRTECKEFIESKKSDDWIFTGEVVEKGISAFKNDVSKRDKLTEIISKAERKEFDILLVYMADRIARKGFQGPSYLERLHNLGIEIWTVKEDKLELSTQEQRLVLYMKFWAAEGESLKTSGRVNDAMINRIKMSKHVGGFAPYGYYLSYTGEISSKERALKELVIDNEQAEIVKEIFNYYVYEGMGAFKIAKVLNERKIPPVKTKEWGSSTITSILKNPIYAGYFAYNRRKSKKRQSEEDWIFSEKERTDLVIISKLIWDKAQTIRKSRNYNNSNERGLTTGSLILMGFTYCGYCGTKLTNASKYNYWKKKSGEECKKITGYYKCTNKANGKLECGARVVYRQEGLEKAVVDEIKKYLNHLKSINIYGELIENQKNQKEREQRELSILTNKAVSIKRDITTMEEQIPSAMRGEYAINIDKLSTLIKNKEQELSEIEKEIISLRQEFDKNKLEDTDLSKFTKLIPNWEEEFDLAALTQKQIMLSDIIDRIDVYYDSIEIKLKIRFESLYTLKSVGFDTTQCIHGSG